MCTESCSRLLVLIFSGIFVLLGAASLAVGIFVLVDEDSYMEYLSRIPIGSESVDSALGRLSILERSAYALCIAGGIILILSIIGFCGACKKKKVLLYLYAIIMLVIFLAEAAGAVLAFIYWDNIENNLKEFLSDTVRDKYDGQTLSVKDASNANNWAIREVSTVSGSWDFAMLEFTCCGVDGDGDFSTANAWTDKNYNYNDGATPFSTTTALIPPACCIVESKSFDDLTVTFTDADGCISSKTSGTYNTKGCYKEIKDYLLNYTYILMGVGIGVAALQLLIIVASCCLIRAINKENNNFA